MAAKEMVIAIDGPAASGKSTIAKEVAKRLEIGYLDTGSMYRAATLSILNAQIDPNDAEAVAATVAEHKYRIDSIDDEHGDRVFIDDIEVTEAIRDPEVSAAVSAVSQIPKIRSMMVEAQREYVGKRIVVVEGRDIGSIVFPRAILKIFLVASARERARRRQIDLRRQGIDIDIDSLEKLIAARDEKDRVRPISPLIKAPDAIVIDTTGKAVETIARQIVEEFRFRRPKRGAK